MATPTRRASALSGPGWTRRGGTLVLRDAGAALSDPGGLAELHAATTEATQVSWAPPRCTCIGTLTGCCGNSCCRPASARPGSCSPSPGSLRPPGADGTSRDASRARARTRSRLPTEARRGRRRHSHGPPAPVSRTSVDLRKKCRAAATDQHQMTPNGRICIDERALALRVWCVSPRGTSGRRRSQVTAASGRLGVRPP